MIGFQVICINGDPPPRGWRKADPVIKGEIYTVTEIGETSPFAENPGVFYLLEEISTHDMCLDGESGYTVQRFRPIKDGDLDIFREIVREVLDKELEEA